MMIDSADIVVGLAWGDEAKGKVSNYLAESLNMDGTNYYSFVCRWNGGSNAGHTIYLNDICYKTHIIPCGVLRGIPSVIGPNCVLNKASFLREVKYIEDAGFDSSLIKVYPNCHVVTDSHIDYDRANLADKLGTTSSGIAPAYSAKAARVGVLAKDVLDESFIFDGNLYGNILCEGAQGFWLDINMGNYPYVTSSETLPYSACSLGFPTQKINRVYGAAKIYDTRSGEDPLFPSSLLDDAALMKIGNVGLEYGVTTGRRRKVNWLNLDKLIIAVTTTGATDLLISKCDVIEEVGEFKLFFKDSLVNFNGLSEMKTFIVKKISEVSNSNIEFSSSPFGV
jgi:adenylosuccinate synthase